MRHGVRHCRKGGADDPGTKRLRVLWWEHGRNATQPAPMPMQRHGVDHETEHPFVGDSEPVHRGMERSGRALRRRGMVEGETMTKASVKSTAPAPPTVRELDRMLDLARTAAEMLERFARLRRCEAARAAFARSARTFEHAQSALMDGNPTELDRLARRAATQAQNGRKAIKAFIDGKDHDFLQEHVIGISSAAVYACIHMNVAKEIA